MFICTSCNPSVENSDGPIEFESKILQKKRDLLFNSRSLEWLMKNASDVMDGIIKQNRSGVASGGNGIWLPPYGAVGFSGRKYYFIPHENCDQFVEPASNPDAKIDGVGEPVSGASWVRFRGKHDNILNVFLDNHHQQGSPGLNLEVLRQDT